MDGLKRCDIKLEALNLGTVVSHRESMNTSIMEKGVYFSREYLGLSSDSQRGL